MTRRTPFRHVILALLLLPVALLARTPAAAAYNTCKDCVEAGNDTSFTPGIVATPSLIYVLAVDPVIAFVGLDGHLQAAMPAPIGWQLETVDPVAAAAGCSMAEDTQGNPVIAYHDDHGVLEVAQRMGGTWSYGPTGAHGAVGSTSTALTPTGVGIAFVDAASGLLEYTERIGTGLWSVQPVGPAGGSEAYPSLIANGPLRAITYYDAANGALRFAIQQAGSGWTTSVIDTGGVGGYSSLIETGSGFGVAYYDFTHRALKYATQGPLGWMAQTVDTSPTGSVGRFCSAVALGGNSAEPVGIAYYDEGARRLKYARGPIGAWSIAVIDTAGGPLACGVSAASPDTVGVAYVGRTRGDLYYRSFTDDLAAAPRAVAGPRLDIAWRRSGLGGRVRFQVPRASAVRVAVYDASGRLTALPFDRSLPAGAAEISWDGRDQRGRAVPTGVFYVRVDAAGLSGSTPAIMLR